MGDEVLQAAFENHISFLSKHRGALRSNADGLTIASEAAGYTTWTPSRAARGLPHDCTAVRPPPWAGADWEKMLADAGFRVEETLAYMQLGEPARPIEVASETQLGVVAGDEDAIAFADVQAEGFGVRDIQDGRWWTEAFKAMALKNWRDPDQAFYLARIDGVSVGSLLTVRTPGMTGIYAVATRPAYRKRGVSASLLEVARQTALARNNNESITLQANKGSYAEGYYRKLGFHTLKELSVWRR